MAAAVGEDEGNEERQMRRRGRRIKGGADDEAATVRPMEQSEVRSDGGRRGCRWEDVFVQVK
jgi:hypothetical protein